MDTLKDFVIANVNAEGFYKKQFPRWNPNSRPNQLCLWHEEDSGSLAIALHNGGAKCHGCKKSIGNIVHFVAESQHISEDQAAADLYSEWIRPVIPEQVISLYEKALAPKVSWLKEIGISPTTAKKFHLGLDLKTKRITLPIPNRYGLPTNVRFYQLPKHRSEATKAKIYNLKGFGHNELFPWNSIKTYTPTKPLFFMKAEKDTMIAIQMGIQAFCQIGGEGSWNEEWNDLFKDFEIGICGDNDIVGRKAAEKMFALWQNSCKFVANLTIPFTRKSKELKDFADWVLLDGGTKVALLTLFNRVKPKRPAVAPPSERALELPALYSDSFIDLIDIGRRPEIHNARVKVMGIVSAKADKMYSIPFKFYVSSSASPKREWTIPVSRELLRLVKSSDDDIISFIKRDLLHNPKAKLEPIDYVSVSEVELIPIVAPDLDSPFTTQRCFFFGKKIEANVPYSFEIIPTTEIRTQETVGIIVSATPIANTLDTFVFDEHILSSLRTFHPEGGVWDGLCHIANEFSLQFSRVYNRIDWHIIALLTWACPIHFNFPNEGLIRGWLNTLAIGDTETGKSKLVQAILRITNAGTTVSGENCSYTGLVGGAIKNGAGQFMLRWGKLPLWNKQLVVVEEFSSVSISEISNLSEVRSSGVARLDKGGLSSETSAKTRLLCLSNVRDERKTLEGYISGVKAIQDLIGHSEDIARFDLITTLTNREVSPDVINSPRSNFDGSLNEENFKLLIKFIWALKPDQIDFTPAAYKTCLEQTKLLGTRYHASIPLFKSSSGRHKLARIAVAIACFQFSWDGSKIVVGSEHVEAAVQLLQMLYDKESCGYLAYSEQMFYREGVREEDVLTATFRAVLPTQDKQLRIINYLLHAAKFTRDELMTVASVSMTVADQLLGRMIASNLLRKGDQNVWEVTPLGKNWMQKQKGSLPESPKQKKQKILSKVKEQSNASMALRKSFLVK